MLPSSGILLASVDLREKVRGRFGREESETNMASYVSMALRYLINRIAKIDFLG